MVAITRHRVVIIRHKVGSTHQQLEATHHNKGILLKVVIHHKDTRHNKVAIHHSKGILRKAVIHHKGTHLSLVIPHKAIHHSNMVPMVVHMATQVDLVAWEDCLQEVQLQLLSLMVRHI
jgi:hypothetical protein